MKKHNICNIINNTECVISRLCTCKMVWKNLRKWLGIAALGASMLVPGKAVANQDLVLIEHNIFKSGDNDSTSLNIGRRNNATEDKDSYDGEYSYPSLRLGQWASKAVTRIQGYDLSLDRRPTNSLTDFNFDLSVVIQNNQDIIGTNIPGISIATNSIYKYIPTNEHWTISYDIKTNYFVEGGAPKTDIKNLREFCPNPNVTNYWTNSVGKGIGISIPASDTNANGEVVFGTGRLHKEYNQLISSSTANGTNNPAGTEILDYNTNKTVNLQANDGAYIDYYILTRTDSTGGVNVVTNPCGTNVTSTNVTLEGLMGSNSVHAVYAPNQYTVQIEGGEPFDVAPTSFSGVAHGAGVTTTVGRIYFTNAPGWRKKFTGFEKTQ